MASRRPLVVADFVPWKRFGGGSLTGGGPIHSQDDSATSRSGVAKKSSPSVGSGLATFILNGGQNESTDLLNGLYYLTTTVRAVAGASSSLNSLWLLPARLVLCRLLLSSSVVRAAWR
jgi:hypothetical protein